MSTEYDSAQDTLAHIRQVGQFLSEAVYELVNRAARHDHSKLLPPEKEHFDRETPNLKEMEYGTEEYKKSLRNLKEALSHHYENNSHHPEHYEDGISGMDLFDLVEMVCDWKAACMRTKDGDLHKSLEHNIERFGIEPQLGKILANTIDRFYGEK